MTPHPWMAPALLVLAGLLPGCATPVRPLYSWGPYEAALTAHFKGESSPEAQIQALEQHALAARAGGLTLPPGYRAHLGMLYAQQGRDNEFAAAMLEEKQNFPESSPYVDNLLKKARSGDKHVQH